MSLLKKVLSWVFPVNFMKLSLQVFDKTLLASFFTQPAITVALKNLFPTTGYLGQS